MEDMLLRGALLYSTLAFAGCRYGFNDVPPGTAADAFQPPDASIGGHVVVRVVGEDAETTAGQPIANATVMIVEQDGSVQTLATAADGTVTTAIGGGTTIHVARPSLELGTWFVYTFAGIGGEVSILAGGAPTMTGTTHQMTATLPPYTSMAFTGSNIRGPLRCIVNSAFWPAVPAVTFRFQPGCTNEVIRLLAVAEQGSSIEASLWLDPTSLVDSSTRDATAMAWSGINKYKVSYTGLPTNVTTVGVIGLLPGSAAGDFIPFDRTTNNPTAGAVDLYVNGPPFVTGSRYATALQTSDGSILTVLDPVDGAVGNFHFDPTHLVAAPSAVTLDHATGDIAWNLDSTSSADMIAVQTSFTSSTNKVTWAAYAPAGTTHLTYPKLASSPPQIAPPLDAAWIAPDVEQILLTDYTYVTALNFLDRDLMSWINDGSHLPTGTVSMTMSSGTVARLAPDHRLVELLSQVVVAH
jgi:hypothetical protein